MSVVYVLLPLALLIAGVMLAFFIWAVRSGQFDDLETPAMRVLFSDTHPKKKKETPAGEAAPTAPSKNRDRERSCDE